MKSEVAGLWSRSSRMGVFLAAFLSMGLSFSALAVDIDLNPTSIVWNTNTWVDITVSNIPPSESVYLGLYVDINTNGSVDGPDVLLSQFTVQDGVTNSLGSRVIPCDRDGQTNGVISAQISYYGVGNIAGLSHGVGPHLWKATAVGSGATAVSQFSVTQPTSTVCITGQVIDSATTNPVAGAFVELWPSFYHDMPLPKTWSTTNGTFHIFLPPEFNRHNLGGVGVNKPGYFMQEEDEQGLGLSEVQFTNSLSLGETILPRPLYVSSSISTQMCSLSGCVYDAATNPVAGILVSLDIESEDDDGGWSFAITDTNGVYALTMAKGAGPAAVYPAGPGVNRLGLVAVGLDVGTITGDISGLDIYCPIATTLAKASVTDADSGAPIAGVTIAFGGEAMGNWGVTIDDGTYEIGLVAATNFEAGVDDEDELRGFGYVTANPYEGLDVPGAGIYTNAPFSLERGYLLTGNVYDEATNALASGWVEARDPGGEWVGGADVNYQGYYEILLATGVYRIATWEYHELGYLNMAYSNYYTWDNWNYDPVTVTTAGVSGVDFYLPQGAYIRGVVMGNAEGLPGADVSVHRVTVDENGDYHWEYHGSVRTEVDGTYEVAVQPGTNYTVRAAVYDDAAYWLTQLYDGVADYFDSTPVSTDTGAPATNINFTLVAGGRISGHVYEEDGVTPVAWCEVEARLDGDWIGDGRTDEDGYYSFSMPAGTYTVEARPDWGDLPYLTQYYSNAIFEADATEVVVTVSNNTSGIDFLLSVGGTISGHVYAEDGTTPIENCHVYTETITGEWVDGADTDVSGYYELRVPGGSYNVSASPGQNGLAYVGEWYDDVRNHDDATEVVVTVSNNTSGIDFLLSVGGTISGHVYEDDGVTPVAWCWVEAQLDGDWIEDSRTDENGYYSFAVPAGSYTVEARPDWEDLPYLTQYYSNTIFEADATEVIVTVSNDTSGIDFHLGPPSYFRGRVTDKDSGQPIAGMSVSVAMIPDPLTEFFNDWVFFGSRQTDGNGYYSAAVPPGSNYIIQTESGNSYYPFRCWSNQVDRSLATLLTIGPDATVSNIDFALEAGGRITGHVFRDDGGAPLDGCDVAAMDYLSGAWLAGTRTAPSGYYSLAVPTGTFYRVEVGPAWNNLPYESEYFDDTTDWNSADPVPVTLRDETSGIDFSVMLSNLDYADWKVHYFTSAELANDNISGDDADPDKDHANNWNEFIADTNPQESNSVLRLTGNNVSGSGLRIDWQGGRWARQYLQRCANLASNDWTDIYTNDTLPTGVTNFVLDSDIDGPAWFHRVKVERGTGP